MFRVRKCQGTMSESTTSASLRGRSPRSIRSVCRSPAIAGRTPTPRGWTLSRVSNSLPGTIPHIAARSLLVQTCSRSCAPSSQTRRTWESSGTVARMEHISASTSRSCSCAALRSCRRRSAGRRMCVFIPVRRHELTIYICTDRADRCGKQSWLCDARECG